MGENARRSSRSTNEKKSVVNSSRGRTTVISPNCYGDKRHGLDNWYKSVRESDFVSDTVPTYRLRQNLEIVDAETSRDNDCPVDGVDYAQSIGRMTSQKQDQEKEVRRASKGKTVWGKVAKGLEFTFRTSASVSKPSAEILRKSPEVRPKNRGKHGGWVRSLLNLFQPHRKKQKQHRSSETFQLNYELLQDGPPTISSRAVFVRTSRPASIGQVHEHNSNARKSPKTVTGVAAKLCDPDLNHLQTFAEIGSGLESDLVSQESIPLLKSPSGPSCHSENRRSDELVYDPLTSHSLPPPWILRKWKLRGSQKLLRIDPPKELRFNLTGDADEQYTCTIKLENVTRRFVAFKFKGTCPQGYLMRPKHGVLAPNTTIEVIGLKIGEPRLGATSKKDLFVIVALPIPSGLMKGNTRTVSSTIFDRFQALCFCEGILHAAFFSRDPNIHKSSVEGHSKVEAILSSVSRILTSIPEEYHVE